MTAPGFAPLEYTLSAEEVDLAAYRAGWRAALRDRFSKAHVAPLIAFTAFMTLIAALAAMGALATRSSEIGLLAGAIIFGGWRTLQHWRVRKALAQAQGAMTSLYDAKTMVATISDDGIDAAGASAIRKWRFDACSEAEICGPLLYLWPREGLPLVAPLRCLGDDSAALLGFLQGRLAGLAADRARLVSRAAGRQEADPRS